MKRLNFAACIFSLLLSFSLGAPSLAQTSVGPIPGAPLERYQVKDRLGRLITYYLSHPKTPAPLLIMIQGSGCSTILRTQGDTTYSTLFDFLPFAAEGKFAVMAVEKPFADPNRGQGGTATDCGPEFNKDFTAERWRMAIEAAIDDASRHPEVDHRRILVFGFSEGAVMAALLAGHDSRITDVVAIGGSGTTQLFDFIASAYQRCFNRSACIAQIEKQLQAINAAPDSASQFAWGHPFKRWSSFFRVDAGDELLRSHARVYLAFGTADTNVPPLSQEVAVAKLAGADRDVTVRRVPDANHALMPDGNPDLDLLDNEYRAALAWFSSAPGPSIHDAH